MTLSHAGATSRWQEIGNIYLLSMCIWNLWCLPLIFKVGGMKWRKGDHICPLYPTYQDTRISPNYKSWVFSQVYDCERPSWTSVELNPLVEASSKILGLFSTLQSSCNRYRTTLFNPRWMALLVVILNFKLRPFSLQEHPRTTLKTTSLSHVVPTEKHKTSTLLLGLLSYCLMDPSCSG